MMFVTEGVFTRRVASEVGSAIKYMIEHPSDDRFFELELVRYRRTKEAEEWMEYFRPLSEEARTITLADESELVHCITKSGRRIDIIFGDRTERDLQPAVVLLGVET